MAMPRFFFGAPAGGSSAPPAEAGGFLSENLANYYALSSAARMPGGADFVAVALVVPTAARVGSKIEPIVNKRSGSTGWYIVWSYGVLEVAVYTTGVACVASAPAAFSSAARLGEVHAIGLRCRSSGGDVFVELWIGPARWGAIATVAGVTVAPNTVSAGQMLAGAFFGDESAANAIFSGVGYYEGTVSDAQMRQIMGRATAQCEIPEDLLAWNDVYQGADVSSAPASWVPTVGSGTMSKTGSPEGVTSFFPPGAAGRL